MEMDATIIKRQIMTNNYTASEINSFVEAIKFARANMARSTARQLTIGDTVKFKDRSGKYQQGVVRNIKIKNAIVDIVNMGRYNVPMSLLEMS
jgi:Tfp pilus assembly protein FimT